MPAATTYGELKKQVQRHLDVIGKLQPKLTMKQEALLKLQLAIETTTDSTALDGAYPVEAALIEPSSDALEPVANPEELWVC